MLKFFVATLCVAAALPIFVAVRDSGLTGHHFAVAVIVAMVWAFVGTISAVMCFAPDARVRPIRLVPRLALAGLYLAIAGIAVAHLTHGYWTPSASSSDWSASR